MLGSVDKRTPSILGRGVSVAATQPNDFGRAWWGDQVTCGMSRMWKWASRVRERENAPVPHQFLPTP